MIERLKPAHWELLEDIEETSLEYGVGDGVFDADGVACGTNAGAPLLIGDDAGRGLVRALMRIEFVGLVEDDGQQTGYAISRRGYEALERRRTGTPLAANLPRADQLSTKG